MPEQFVDRQALIMVLDFGKLYFTNKGDPSDTTGTRCLKLISHSYKNIRWSSEIKLKNISIYLKFMVIFSFDFQVPGSAVSGEDDYEPEDDEFCTPVSSPGLLSEAKTPLITGRIR